jgi:hypothetical protein
MRVTPDIEKIYTGQDISYFSFGRDYAKLSSARQETARTGHGRGRVAASDLQESAGNRQACLQAFTSFPHLPYK